MANPSQPTSQRQYDSIPTPNHPDHLRRGYGGTPLAEKDELHFSTATPGNLVEPSPLSQSVQRHDSQLRDGSDFGRNIASIQNGNALSSASPSRGSTLKKKSSLRGTDGRRSILAETIKSRVIDHEEKLVVGDENNPNSAYYTPVPTSGAPTEVLANRFQAWRQVLKDLIAYYRELQTSYETRSKSLLKVSNVVNNTVTPAVFMTEGEGSIADSTHILRDFHKKSILESNKAKEIEEDVIAQLTGLRSDLHQKVKEIKGLSGDFKNSVEREMGGTRKAVHLLKDALHQIDTEPNAPSAKEDPFLVRLAVEKQLERQIEEENYLHRAYLNLEGSGRELDSIVVGEIQKSYNALASILRREADEAYDAIEHLRAGPLSMPKDYEWNTFVERDPRFVDPRVPLRKLERIEYPGKYHPAASEVRSGMLERKSKYLKSYSPGWYVLSPTHLHEYKSPDRIHLQNPVMSLFLSEQKLGSHSQPGSSSHKFILKGRQTGGMHRGHSWVFRAESHDTMMAWYQDIKNLTEKTGEERHAFVRQHARSISSQSQTAVSVDSDGGLEEDEADQTPYSASAQTVPAEDPTQETVVRPQPGGRFPSDLRVERGLRAPPRSPSSASSEPDRDVVGMSRMSPRFQEPAAGQSMRPAREVESPNRDVYFPVTGSTRPLESKMMGDGVERSDQYPAVPASSAQGPDNQMIGQGIGSVNQEPAVFAPGSGGPVNTFIVGGIPRTHQHAIVAPPTESQQAGVKGQAEPIDNYAPPPQPIGAAQAAAIEQPRSELEQPSGQSSIPQEIHPEPPSQVASDVPSQHIPYPNPGLVGMVIHDDRQVEPTEDESKTYPMDQVQHPEQTPAQAGLSGASLSTNERRPSPVRSENERIELPATATETPPAMTVDRAARHANPLALNPPDGPSEQEEDEEIVVREVTVATTEVHTRAVLLVPSEAQIEGS